MKSGSKADGTIQRTVTSHWVSLAQVRARVCEYFEVFPSLIRPSSALFWFILFSHHFNENWQTENICAESCTGPLYQGHERIWVW